MSETPWGMWGQVLHMLWGSVGVAGSAAGCRTGRSEGRLCRLGRASCLSCADTESSKKHIRYFFKVYRS